MTYVRILVIMKAKVTTSSWDTGSLAVPQIASSMISHTIWTRVKPFTTTSPLFLSLIASTLIGGFALIIPHSLAKRSWLASKIQRFPYSYDMLPYTFLVWAALKGGHPVPVLTILFEWYPSIACFTVWAFRLSKLQWVELTIYLLFSPASCVKPRWCLRSPQAISLSSSHIRIVTGSLSGRSSDWCSTDPWFKLSS
jgi:hypothetical protein